MSNTIELRSDNAPNGWGGYRWETTESVVAVPYEEALQLIRIPHAGYHAVDAYDSRPKRTTKKPKATEPEVVPDFVAGEMVGGGRLETALDLVSAKGSIGKG